MNAPENPQFEPTQIRPPDSSASAMIGILDQYLADLQAGKPTDRATLLAEHPDLAAQLDDCLDGIEFVHRTSLSPDAAPSQLGDFRIIREIGRGGMGFVYEAEQVSLKRRVALKVLRFGGVADGEAVLRFEREAETVAGLEHGNIVPVYAVGTENGVHYYAMQLIDGSSLADVLKEQATEITAADARVPPSATRIAEWGRSAAQALAYAHRNGVVHRDVKPSNLILDRGGRLWLTDFGLARRSMDATLSLAGALLGTPRYMSPEQAAAAKKPVDHRTDIYSLGATLYELATGKPVFDADTPQGVITQILTTVPRAPRNLDPDLPGNLETIILKCLEKDPADRYATATDLADDLQAFMDDRPIRARRATLIERAVQSVRRHRRMASAAGLSAILAATLVVGGLLVSRYYTESRMGTVSLTTSGPRMVGEILDIHEQSITADFPVPTTKPLKLPAGEYTLRLSTDGLLSESWPLEIHRGEQQSLTVGFRSRWLWPPQELNPNGWTQIDILDFAGAHENPATTGADLLIQSYEKDQSGQSYQTRLRCIKGATGDSAWASDLVFQRGTAPDVPHAAEWSSMLRDPGILSDDLNRLVRPLADLNGDGHGDVILLSRSKPSLVAVSGKSGTVLWWHRARPPLPHNHPLTEGRWTSTRASTVLGQPTMVHVDDDGTSDVVCCFLSDGETFRTASGTSVASGPRCWIEAVSGSTGETLWSTPVDTDLSTALNSSEEARRAHTACRIAIAQSRSRSVAVTIIDQQLIGLDPATGEAAWEPQNLGFDPFRPPVLQDLDDDGSTDVLLVRRIEGDKLAAVSIPLPVQTGTSGPDGVSPTFTATFRPAERSDERRDGNGDWIVTEDLNQDGTLEIIMATGKFEHEVGAGPGSRWSGVEVIDGGSGEVVWKRRLTVTDQIQPPAVSRIVTGPDLNGDGFREVFAAWPGPSSAPDWERESYIRVVALSGRDGATLWRWQERMSRSFQGFDHSAPLTWWQSSADGYPMLVVPVARARGGQDVTYLLSSATGRLEHTLSDVAEPRSADLNGDLIPELFYRVSPQGSPRLIVLKGDTSEPWKRLGQWHAIADIDDDQVSDFLKRDGQTAVSGRNSRVLWQCDTLFDDDLDFMSPQLPFGDVNDDGVPDIVGLRDQSARDSYRSLAAISGLDGRTLWQGDDFGMVSGRTGVGGGRRGYWHWPASDWTDLDGDGRAEFLVAHVKRDSNTNSPIQSCLSVLSGRDGSLRWQTPVVMGSALCQPDPYGRTYDDLDADGSGDVVVWAPVSDALSSSQTMKESSKRRPVIRAGTTETIRKDGSENDPTCVLRAISGRDGSVLWTADAVTTMDNHWLWPQPAVGDLDGDGIPEVIAGRDTSEYVRDRGIRSELFALDGRTGQVKWMYSWWGSSGILPPLLVDFDGDGRRSVCLPHYESGHKHAIVVLDDRGTVRDRIPLELGRSMEFRMQLWNYGDLDADGREELLFADESRLYANRGRSNDNLWTYELPHRKAALTLTRGISATQNGTDEFDSREPESPAMRPTQLVLWSGVSLFGLDPETGKAIWRCDGQTEPNFASSHPPQADVLYGPQRNGPPSVLVRGPSSVDSWATISHQAWAIDGQGIIQPPAPQPCQYGPAGEEPRPLKSLPWMTSARPGLKQHLTCLLIPSGLSMFLIMVVPVWLVRTTLQRSTVVSAIGPLLALSLVAACGCLGPFPQAVSSVFALSLPVLFLIRSGANRLMRDVMLAAAALVLLLLPLIVVQMTSRALVHSDSWAGWYWLDELLLEPLLTGVVAGVPGYVYWRTLWNLARRSAWRQITHLLLGTSVLAFVFAVISIGLVTGFNPDSINFTSNGWYIIWFWGVFAFGVTMTISSGLNRIREWRRRQN